MEKVIITLIVCWSAVMVLRVICGTILAMHATTLKYEQEQEQEEKAEVKEGGLPPVAKR